MQASNVQEKGKIKVKALIENFEESCRAKVANKSFSPATFKTGKCLYAHLSFCMTVPWSCRKCLTNEGLTIQNAPFVVVLEKQSNLLVD